MTLNDRLHSEGYDVETAADGDEAVHLANARPFDLVILDLMLPKKSGLDVCRDLRQRGFHIPIMVLTARDQVIDKVVGLKLGADDYVTKPFDMMELLARIEALLRRSGGPQPSASAAYQFGRVRVDFRSTEVFLGEEKVQLSAREFQLLKYFIEHRGETLSRERLLNEVWGYNSAPQTRTVDVHIVWLRQKLEDDPKNPRWIATVHGMGYKFNG